jgi:anti-sigma factor RsiW
MAKLTRARPRRINDSCETMTELIADYLYGRMAKSLRREFEAHLSICPDCVSFLNTYRKTAALGASVSVGDLPPKMRANVLAFLRQKMHKIAVLLLSLIVQGSP